MEKSFKKEVVEALAKRLQKEISEKLHREFPDRNTHLSWDAVPACGQRGWILAAEWHMAELSKAQRDAGPAKACVKAHLRIRMRLTVDEGEKMALDRIRLDCETAAPWTLRTLAEMVRGHGMWGAVQDGRVIVQSHPNSDHNPRKLYGEILL